VNKTIFVIFLILFSNTYAHKQWVHKYLVNEAYSLFENSNLTGEITPMFESFFKDVNGNFYQIGPPNHPSVSLVADGAWNEDDFDIVFGHTSEWVVIPTPSATHFWDPDNIDRYDQNFLEFITGSKENAFKKAEYMWNGTGKFLMSGPFQFDQNTEEGDALEERGLSFSTVYNGLIIGYDNLPSMYKDYKYYI